MALALTASSFGLRRIAVSIAQVAPVAAVGNREAMVLGLRGERLVAAVVGQRPGVLLVPPVREPLVEEQREDVRLEVRRVDRPPQPVRRCPEPRLELLQRDHSRRIPCTVGSPYAAVDRRAVKPTLTGGIPPAPNGQE